MAFLDNWHVENKPSLLLFDQVPLVPLLYKVGDAHICLQAVRLLITLNILMKNRVVQPGSSPG